MESGKLFEDHAFDPVTKIRILMLLFVTGGVSGWLYEMGFYRLLQDQFRILRKKRPRGRALASHLCLRKPYDPLCRIPL